MNNSKMKFLLVATLGLFLFQGTTTAQNLKSLINKVTENESVKKVVDAVKENETVKTTVEAVKVSVIEGVNAKIEELKNPKAAESSQVSPAQAMAPDVKNSISDVRAFTGLTKEEFETKVKALGFAAGVDDATLGTTLYSSKTAGYSLTTKMGIRNNINYIREITKTSVAKKANLVTVKSNFLKLGTQVEELKATFKIASIKAKSAKGTNVEALNTEEKTAKLIPAFNKFSAKKEDGLVTDTYSEIDYIYELNLKQTTVKGISTAVTSIKVTDLTAAIQ